MNRVRIAAAALTAAATLAGAAGAATTAVFLHVSPTTVHRGHVVIIRGNAGDCGLGSTVFIISGAFAHTHDFAGVPAVLARVRAGGKFGIRPRIPSSKAPGSYTVSARCGGGNLGVSAHLTVVA